MARPNALQLVLGVGPAVAYLVALFVLGSVRRMPMGAFEVNDKLLHFVAFGILTPLVARALTTLIGQIQRVRLAICAVVASSAFAALLELWQAFFPGRHPDARDWLAGTLGAALCGLVVALRTATSRAA